MRRMMIKLKALEKIVKTWNWKSFGNMDNQVRLAEKRLDEVQIQLQSNNDSLDLQAKEMEEAASLVNALHI